MPITKKFVAQDQEEAQILKMDADSRFIVNNEKEWQFIFNGNSSLTSSSQVVKISAEFNKDDLDSIRVISYLYNPITGSVDSSATCVFSLYKIVNPNWSDVFQSSFNGTVLPNSYHYIDVPLTSLSSFNFDGGDTLMIEAVITRSTYTYRDRVYVNHLGIYDSMIQVKKKAEFLELTKLDE